MAAVQQSVDCAAVLKQQLAEQVEADVCDAGVQRRRGEDGHVPEAQ